MKNRGKVFLYNISKERQRQILPLCVKAGASVRTVAPSEYGQKLGALAGHAGYSMDKAIYDGSSFTDEMLVLDGFTGRDLDAFLNSFRQAKVRPVALKAVITDHNQEWDSVTLHEEISKEHEYMWSQKKEGDS